MRRVRGNPKIHIIVCMLVFFALSKSIVAQELPPRPIEVTITLEQGIKFGSFYHGSAGGTVTVDENGVRSASGDVYLLDYEASPAVFTITAIPGTTISLLAPPESVLSGAGGTMTMNLGQTDPPLPFVATSEQTQVRIGGTLTVGNSLANPAGEYSGSFLVIFNQE